MGVEVKYSDCKMLYKISKNEEICGIRKMTKPTVLSNETNLIALNKAAKRSGLFDDVLFEKAEHIRKARNKIHTYGLQEVDDKYSKDSINEIFAMTKLIIERIETY